MGDSDGSGVTGSAKRDGAVLAQGRAWRGRRCWKIVSLAVGLEQEKSVVVVERLASDVGIYGTGACLILKRDIDGSHYADYRDDDS